MDDDDFDIFRQIIRAVDKAYREHVTEKRKAEMERKEKELKKGKR